MGALKTPMKLPSRNRNRLRGTEPRFSLRNRPSLVRCQAMEGGTAQLPQGVRIAPLGQE